MWLWWDTILCQFVRCSQLSTVKYKVEFTLEQATNSQRGSRGYLYSIFNLGPRLVEDGQHHAPAAWPLGRHGTHCVGGWVGPRAGSWRVRKISPTPGFDPQTVQPIKNIYTDWDILALSGKSIPVTGLDRPRGFQEIKFPRFHDNGTGWW